MGDGKSDDCNGFLDYIVIFQVINNLMEKQHLSLSFRIKR